MKNVHWFFKVCFLILLLLFFWFTISFILPKILPTKIISGEVRGLIFQNQIWKGEVIITGDLVTMPEVKLNIEPGSRIIISKGGDKNNLDIIPWHLQHGINTGPEYRGIKTSEPFWDEKEKIFIYVSNLEALGQNDKPIIITSKGLEGSPYDINLIRIQKGEVSKVIFSNYRRLEIGPEVRVLDSKFENSGECAICVNSGSPLIKGNAFKIGKRDYINIQEASPLILGNHFFESSGDGVFIQSSEANPVRIFNNIFEMPNKKSIRINTINQTGEILGNNFKLGDMQFPCQTGVKLVGNSISVKVMFVNIGGCSGEYIFGENYWEIDNTQNIINARISGISEYFKVRIPRILKLPPKGI